MDNVSIWEYEKLVDRIDEDTAKAFYTTFASEGLRLSDDPLRCYLLLILLLSEICKFRPGMNLPNVKERMRQYLDNKQFNEIEQIAKQIAENFLQIIHPTYTAASYWSPIDERRHTISLRRELRKDENERETWAYAYAFYILTFIGQESGFYSATQYIAVQALRKQGVRVCYLEEPEDGDPNNWWHIPRGEKNCNHKRILNETGLTDAIKNHLLQDDIPSNHFRDQLRMMLINRDNGSWHDVKSFAANFIRAFPPVISNVSKQTRDDVRKTQDYINNLLNTDLNEEQALFMLMTNLIYDVAFPTNYFYGFPVRIDKLCSIMTVGTERALKPFEYLALTRVVNSIFMHPLLLDYATQQAEARDSKNKVLLMGGCAHSANNALLMAGIRSVTGMLTSGEPPQDAKFSLHGGGNTESALDMLRGLWVGGTTAQAFIAFIEMATHPGALRRKFQSGQSYTLEKCLAEAETMANLHLRGETDPTTVKIDRGERVWADVQLPATYLKEIYIQTLLYELLLNVGKHGATRKPGETYIATASIAIDFNEDTTKIYIGNMLKEQDRNWVKIESNVALPSTAKLHRQAGSTFLQFASIISKFVAGVSIETNIQEARGIKYYRAVLTLGPIQVVTSEGELCRVHPALLGHNGSQMPDSDKGTTIYV